MGTGRMVPTGRLDEEDAGIALLPDGVLCPAQERPVVLLALDAMGDIAVPS